MRVVRGASNSAGVQDQIIAIAICPLPPTSTCGHRDITDSNSWLTVEKLLEKLEDKRNADVNYVLEVLQD